MRDIVSEVGTFYTGLSACPTISSTQTSPAVSLAGYDGCMIYILNPTATSAGTMTPVVQVTNDNNGSPASGNWTAVAAPDLVLWQATSNSDYTPVKATDSSGLPTGNAQPTVLSSTTAINQRVGYIGYQFTTSGGATYEASWLRVVSTVASSWSAPYDVIILLGRPRKMPASV
jgi:hypothetical protein